MRLLWSFPPSQTNFKTPMCKVPLGFLLTCGSFLSFFLQSCPDNGVDLVPGLHIPEDSVSNANPADFDWGASEFVERRQPPRRTPGARRLQHTTDFFASGVLESWGSQDQAGFGATDVRFRPRHCFPPQVFSRIYLGLQICYRGKCNCN